MSLIVCFVLFFFFDVSVARNIHDRFKRSTKMVSRNLEHNQTFFDGINTIVEDYPENDILKAILSFYDSNHKVDHFFEGFSDVYSINNVLRHRHSRSESAQRKLCDSIISTVTPLTMKNTSDQRKYIVNNKKYKQNMRIEKCSTDTSAFHPNIKCIQRYQKLYLLTFENFKLSYDEFNVPIICEASCVVS
ncbi:neurotrophin 1-like [Diorhabda sublineata]|uniref:neurotrophin 1-like n=1 Tax=Diorhabda sublineata TaxID=1163346 RepID=UPI0024E1213E|nr:neurotrophin 1-like [Diorhabda sublineata]